MVTGWWFQPLWKILVSWELGLLFPLYGKMLQTTNQVSSPCIQKSNKELQENWDMHVFCYWITSPSEYIWVGSQTLTAEWSTEIDALTMIESGWYPDI